MSYEGSPPPPLSRGALVVGLYGALGILAFLIAAGRGNPDLYRLGGEPEAWQLAAGPAIGVALGVAMIVFTRIASRHFQWARDLHTSFRDLLGPLTGKDIWLLALASSIGEELLFRGALLPWLGIWAQAAVFALLHIGPVRRFWPWTIWAFGLGLAFGWLAEWSGNLGGPIAAHFVINYFNLKFIVRVAPARAATA